MMHGNIRDAVSASGVYSFSLASNLVHSALFRLAEGAPWLKANCPINEHLVLASSACCFTELGTSSSMCLASFTLGKRCLLLA